MSATLGKFKNAMSRVMDNFGSPNSSLESLANTTNEKRLEYTRPKILNLTMDEVKTSADHMLRPILVPRECSSIPLKAGYAECINAGKSQLNEDQAHTEILIISQYPEEEGKFDDEPLECEYFGLFDGHAGYDAALLASQNLHLYLQEELCKIKTLLFADRTACTCLGPSIIKHDDLIVGALERCFLLMDEKIRDLKANGGCTANVFLRLHNRVYIANAGDSRAILVKRNGMVEALSYDHTPNSSEEFKRIQNIAVLKPHLMHEMFTADIWQRRPSVRDIGLSVLCKPTGCQGWISRKVSENHLKPPVIFGSGKKSRLLGTIGVTRGLGDHFLKVHSTEICIKPFLSCLPEIRIIEPEVGDLVIMATDGLWDVISNERTAEKILSVLQQHEFTDDRKLNAVALELIMQAQNPEASPTGLVSPDDISVFVIPISQSTKINSNENLAEPEPLASLNDENQSQTTTTTDIDSLK